MKKAGIINSRQLVVAAATLALWVPCIAQFTMMIKERGAKAAAAMAAVIFPFEFAYGFIINKFLLFFCVNLE